MESCTDKLAGSGKRNRLLCWGLLFYLLFLFATVLIRSVISGITYDEACSYLFFGVADLLDVHTLKSLFMGELCVANNHWMNSVLINLCYRLIGADYSEFMIRLPVLLFFVLYLVGVVYGYRRGFYSLTALVFLVSNYYLLEFYGLARGYGMANTCVFFACLACLKWRQSAYREMRHLNWCMVYLAMAVFCNTIVLLLYPAVGLVGLVRILQTKSFPAFLKKSGVVFVPFMLFSLVMVVFHMNISAAGKPLYTGGEQSFFKSVVVGYAEMFTGGGGLALALAVLFAVLGAAAFALIGKDAVRLDLPMMLLVFAATNVLMQLLMRKGYIATRVLLPFYSFVVLCCCELFSNAIGRLKGFRSVKRGLLILVCALLILSTCARTDLHSTKDWQDDYKYSAWVLGAELTGEPYGGAGYQSASEMFYQQKYQALREAYLSDIASVK